MHYPTFPVVGKKHRGHNLLGQEDISILFNHTLLISVHVIMWQMWENHVLSITINWTRVLHQTSYSFNYKSLIQTAELGKT